MAHKRQFSAAAVLTVMALTVVGCGASAGATNPTPTVRLTHAHTATPTAVLQVEPTATAIPTDTATAEPATPTPTATHIRRKTATATPPASAAPRLLSLRTSTNSVKPSGSVTISASTTGEPARVAVYLSSGPANYNASYRLIRTSPGAWSVTFTAPPAPGQYHYGAVLYNSAGTSYPVDNDAWNITVLATSTPTSQAPPVPSTIPDDIPLAPPFNYGNPVPATFSAEGETVEGAEVVSNSRPDIKPSVVSEWYINRFPRAGWTVDPATIPTTGATSFTIVASSNGRYCVVSYAASVVHVYFTVTTG